MGCDDAARRKLISAEHCELINGIAGLTLTSKVAQVAMIEAVERIEREAVPGDIVECGVWRGGNIILARKVAPTRVCWLFDTFEGMTEPGPEDFKRPGKGGAIHTYRQKKALGEPWCAAGLDEVKINLSEAGVYDESRLMFVVGDVNQTLLDENLPDQIAILRLDTDWYQSTAAELRVLYPRLSVGGVLIIDDFGHWKGAQKATREYFGDEFLSAEMVVIDKTVVLIRKS